MSIPDVDLSDNRLGDFGAQAIGSMLKENSTLVWLNLSNNAFTDCSAEFLGPALVTNAKLQHLDLSHNALGLGDRAGSYTLLTFFTMKRPIYRIFLLKYTHAHAHTQRKYFKHYART